MLKNQNRKIDLSESFEKKSLKLHSNITILCAESMLSVEASQQ